MAELYGIQSVIKPSLAQTPVSIGTEVVFIAAAKSNNHRYKPKRVTSYDELKNLYNGSMFEFSYVADYAFNTMNLDHIWAINIGSDSITDSRTVTEASAKAGVDAVHDIYNEYGVVPTIVVLVENNFHIASPSGSVTAPEAILAYANGVCSNISDHFKAQIFYDQTVTADEVTEITRNSVSTGVYQYDLDYFSADMIDLASGSSISCVGRLLMSKSDTQGIPMSIVASCLRANQDAMNTGGVPSRSVGNLSCVGGVGYSACVVPSTGTVSYYPLDNTKAICDALAERSFVVCRNTGMNRFVTWGDHTAGFASLTSPDELYRFDSNVAMAYHLANRWILKWGNVIDNPMNLSLRNDVINEEQSYLDYLVSIGALVGNPKCEFRAIDNTSDTLGQGQFYFTDTYTSAIPAKYLQMNLVWTSEGLASYLED